MARTVANEKFRFEYTIAGDDAKKELGELERSTRKVNEETKQLRLEKSRLKAQNKQNTQEYRDLTARIKENATTLASNKARMEVLRREIGLTGLTMKQLSAEASKLKLQLHNMTPGTSQFQALQAQLQAVNSRMSELRNGARATESSMSRWANGFNKYAAMGASFIAVLTGVVFKLQQIIDFNGKMSESMSDVQKTTGMTAKEVDELAKSFGILQTRTSRIDLLKIAEQGGRIGIAKDEIAAFVGIMDKAVVALGDEFPGGAEETANSLGKLKSLFIETRDLGVDEAYNAIGSAINELGASGLASAPNLANFTTRVGSMTDAIRPAIADALGLAAAFQESGLEAEVSARAYSIFLGDVATKSDKFAQVMGVSTQEVENLLNTNPTEFFLTFSEGLKGMNATEVGQTLNFLGLNADGVNKILGAASSNTQLFRDKMVLANDSMAAGTSLIEEYNIKNNNFQATLDKIGKTIRGIFVSDAFVGFITGFTDWVARFIGATEDASGSTQRWRGFLLLLTKLIIIGATGLISYTTAIKLYTLWTTRAAIGVDRLNLVQKAYLVTMRTGAGITLLAKAAFFVLTGQISKATQVMRIFNTVVKLNPWVFLGAAVVAVIAAFVAFSGAAKKARTEQEYLSDSLKTANENIAGQVGKVKALDAVVRDETKSQDERRKAIAALNKIVPNYNEDLDLGAAALQRSKVFLDNYIDALKRQAQAQALANLMTAKAEELERAKNSSAEANVEWYEQALAGASRIMYGGTYDSAVNDLGSKNRDKNVALLQEEFDALGKVYADFEISSTQQKSPIELEIEKLERNRAMVEKTSGAYARLTAKIDALKKQNKSIFNVPTGDEPKDPKTKPEKDSFDYLKELRDQRYAAAEEKAKLIKDDFEREMALEKLNHAKRVEELQLQIIDVSKLSGKDKENALAINASINERILLGEKSFEQKKGKLLADNVSADLAVREQGHERALQQLKITQANELAAFKGTDVERKALLKKHQEEEATLQIAHAQELQDEIISLLQAIQYEGLDMSLLSEQENQTLLDRIEELRLKLAELGLVKDAITTGDINANVGFGNGLADGVDILGFSIGDYERMFTNLDTTSGKIEALGAALGGLGDIYASYANMLGAREQNELQEFQRNQERRKDILQRRLDGGFISQKQYNAATKALEEEAAKKQAEIEYNRAKRDKIMAVANIISNGAIAVSKAIAASPLTVGMPWAGIIAGQTALQLGLALATPLPAKGYEDGLYIKREQDGKVFNARNGGRSRSGLVSSPTYFQTSTGGFLAGENSTSTDPEMIIDRRTLRGFDPGLKQSLYRAVSRARGFESGYYPQQSTNSTANSDGAAPAFNNVDTTRLESLMTNVIGFLEMLRNEGVYINKDMRNIQSLIEEQERYQRYKNKSRP